MTPNPTKEEIQIAAQVALIERLRISERRYSNLVNGLSSVVFSIDQLGNITFLNNAWSNLLGHERSEMQGLNLSQFLLHTDSEIPYSIDLIVPTSQTPEKEFKCKVLGLSGDMVWFNYSAHFDTESKTISGTMHDITKEVKLEQERVSLEQARNNFFSGMSHDLRTPINGTILASELITQSTEGEVAKYADAIRNSSRHLLDIIDEILDYSKIEAAQLRLHNKAFHLQQEVQTTADIFNPICLRKNVDLNVNIGENVPKQVIADAKRLKQILNNLLSNASKFTLQGKITLTMSAKINKNDCELIFSVEDTGIGIGAEKLPKLFAPFSQVDDSIQSEFGGTGLGLSLTKELVELMGGAISVRSELGVGTTFCFNILCSIPERGEVTKKEFVETSTDNSKIHVLIVEDDMVTSMALSAMLIKHHGYSKDNLTVVGSGVEMRASLNTSAIDLVFMDCNLPDSDGATLISEIRNHLKAGGQSLPYVIFSTASTGDREASLIEKSCPNASVIKPITSEKLAVLVQGYYSLPQLARHSQG